MRHKDLKKQFSVILSVAIMMGLAVLLITGFITHNKSQPQENAVLFQNADGNLIIAIVGEELPILFQSDRSYEMTEYSGQNAVLQISKCETLISAPVCIEPKQDTWVHNRQIRRLQRNLQCTSVPWYYYVQEFKPGNAIRARSQF
jgi:hypothetical protein